MTRGRKRLDILLTERGLAPSRSRARDMIQRGCVAVDGQPLTKAGLTLNDNVRIVVDDPASGYVSRAALKLVAGLDKAQISVTDRNALDLGASTGGFTQVLLERGAKHVWAVDVGHDQMTPHLRDDPRVTCIEGFNARHLTAEHISRAPDIVVSDMSFISLRIAAQSALLLAAAGADAVLLVKPQFEVGPKSVGKGGLVTDKTAVSEMLKDIRSWFSDLSGWRVIHLIPSPIEGGDGNTEYLLCGKRDV